MPDTQTLGLVIAASLAGLVCLRLYWVLGRRTGQEPQRGPAPTLPAQPAPQLLEPPVAGGNGLLDIQLADRSFDTQKFLSGARQAYARIVGAFAAGDRDTLRPLLSPDVYAAFDAGIAGRSEAPAAFVRLSDARIVGAALHGTAAEITLAFTAQFANGSVTDVWTFARTTDAADPNWTLVATSGDLPE
ncbi:MAG TPA: Tim44/TimA family putative adaptor protein [Rhizomicrobium sp.]|jgi:predicted lipid-binding transport protein (Tim44 family)|nr:Tim44/TimA family putative adaptor protein [Rhizomicrobium sp.]